MDIHKSPFYTPHKKAAPERKFFGEIGKNTRSDGMLRREKENSIWPSVNKTHCIKKQQARTQTDISTCCRIIRACFILLRHRIPLVYYQEKKIYGKNTRSQNALKYYLRTLKMSRTSRESTRVLYKRNPATKKYIFPLSDKSEYEMWSIQNPS